MSWKLDGSYAPEKHINLTNIGFLDLSAYAVRIVEQEGSEEGN